MNDSNRFRLASRLRSIGYALRGLRLMLILQHNARIHAGVTLLVLLLGAALRISRGDLCWLVLAIAIVWTAEAMNTALEFLCDVASPEFHPLVEKAKDVAAGGVLISSLGAAAIGLLVLGPPLWTWAMGFGTFQ
jgi:diacylglycerol kinase (ATP)